MVTKDELRECMSRFATGVTIITTLDEAGELHGMSASSFTSVCLEPPLVLICVGHGTRTFRYVEEQGHFGVNILSADQEEVGKYFARSPEDRKGDVSYEWTLSEGCGLPALSGTMAFFGCKVESAHAHGDHTIYVASANEVYSGDAENPLMFFQRKWYTSIGAGK